MSVNPSNLNPASVNSATVNPSGTGGSAAAGKTAQLDPVRIQSSSSAATKSTERTDEVQLSGLSNKINELQSGSPAREAYLESLRLEVASGQYDADPAATARSIVEDALSSGE